MARTRLKQKGRRESGSFLALPHSIVESDEWAALSAHGVKLLVDLFAQYRGANNGDLAAAWPIMKARGWTSKAMLYRALQELREAQWIVLTRQGGRAALGAHRQCSLYAVTWKPIDFCEGKLDVQHTSTPSNAWREIKTAAPPVDSIGLDVWANEGKA